MPNLRPLLLVEDNPNDVELTVNALQEARLVNTIDVVNDGEQALDYLFRRGAYAHQTGPLPAVILLDLKMPKVDGHEVLRAIRADPVLRLTPVVMLTSSREESDLYRSYESGANAYVVKPVGFEDFVAAINQLGFFWALLNEPPPARP
ncbi:MAG TPA: response regulator [Opitutaceae bacterium]